MGLICGSSFSQQVDNDLYNLSFNPKSASLWQFDFLTYAGQFTYDSTQLVNGKYPFLIRRSLAFANWNTTSLSKRIIFPNAISDSIRVSIHNSCGYLTNAILYVWRYNDREGLVSKDSLNINIDGWHTHSISLPARTTRILQLDIFVRALGQTVLRRELWNQLGFMQFLALDRVEIKVGNKDISELEVMTDEKLAKPVILDPTRLVPLTNVSTQSLPALRGKKIVALGETVHFNNAIEKFKFDVTKSLIINNNCRMVLLEMPYDIGVMYNYYVGGGKLTPEFERIMQGTMRPQLSSSFWEFLQWLKNFNQSQQRKVMLLGMDDSHSSNFPIELDILDAALTIPAERAMLADLFDYIANKDFIHAEFEIIKQREVLVKLFGLQDYEVLKCDIHFSALNNDQSFYTTGKYFGSLDYRYLLRDATMSQVAGKYLSWLQEDETACIHAHYLHISKTYSGRPRLPLGYYLEKEYGTDYFPLAVLVGSGTSTMFTMKDNNLSRVSHFDYKLNTPPPRSLEDAAGKISDKCFYYPLDSTNYEFNYIRIMGSNVTLNKTKDQFNLVSPKAGVDGFIYIPDGTAYAAFQDNEFYENENKLHVFRYNRLLAFKKKLK